MAAMTEKKPTRTGLKLSKTWSDINSVRSRERVATPSSHDLRRFSKRLQCIRSAVNVSQLPYSPFSFVVDPSDFQENKEDASAQNTIHSFGSKAAAQISVHSTRSTSSAERVRFNGSPLGGVEGNFLITFKNINIVLFQTPLH